MFTSFFLKNHTIFGSYTHFVCLPFGSNTYFVCLYFQKYCSIESRQSDKKSPFRFLYSRISRIMMFVPIRLQTMLCTTKLHCAHCNDEWPAQWVQSKLCGITALFSVLLETNIIISQDQGTLKYVIDNLDAPWMTQVCKTLVYLFQFLHWTLILDLLI